jgi:hypothetical protein
VNDILVLLDFEQIVVDADPQAAVIVCVKLVDCLVTVSVCAVFNVPLATLNVLFLGIVVNVLDPEQLTGPLGTTGSKYAEHDSVLVPLSACFTLTVFVYNV